MKLGLFSVSYAGRWGQHALGLIEFIRKAAELGYDAVMLMGKRPHLSPLDVTAEQIESIRHALREHSLECAAVGAYVDLACVGAADVPYLEMQIGYVESLARIASQLNAPIVRVFSGYEQPGVGIHSSWRQVVESLQEMCDRAAACNITIAVQNHHDIAVHSQALLELLYDVDRPNCRLGFDAWSPALRGEDLYSTARKMAPHAAITTNADYVRLPRFSYRADLVNYLPVMPDMVRAVKFGQGFIDYDAFFRGLLDGGFSGIAIYEMCSYLRGGSGLANLDDYARNYVAWMRTHEAEQSTKTI